MASRSLNSELAGTPACRDLAGVTANAAVGYYAGRREDLAVDLRGLFSGEHHGCDVSADELAACRQRAGELAEAALEGDFEDEQGALAEGHAQREQDARDEHPDHPHDDLEPDGDDDDDDDDDDETEPASGEPASARTGLVGTPSP